jgi:Domain of unknown function (DUF4500)
MSSSASNNRPTQKPQTPQQQNAGGKSTDRLPPPVPKHTSLFRVLNFELFVKPTERMMGISKVGTVAALGFVVYFGYEIFFGKPVKPRKEQIERQRREAAVFSSGARDEHDVELSEDELQLQPKPRRKPRFTP